MIDADGGRFQLFSVQLTGLSILEPNETQQRSVAAINTFTFRVIRQRWNLNAVRLPLNPDIWQRDGNAYLDRIEQAVKLANAEGLVVNLAAIRNSSGLPTEDYAAFWSALAQRIRDYPMLVLTIFARPITSHQTGERQAEDWDIWRNGGGLADGTKVVGMQALVNTIRASGVQQIIAASAFDDPLDFARFAPEHALDDANVIYEFYPFFDHSSADADRSANLGFVGARYPLYAGEWGAPLQEDSTACLSLPSDPGDATEAVLGLLGYFAFRNISWSASNFEPGQLIADFERLEPTSMIGGWTCSGSAETAQGIGGILLLLLTGDPYGFGSIAPDQIASAAGGPAGPVSPGQIVILYGQYIGPEADTNSVPDASGKLPADVADTKVFFNGQPAPIVTAGYFAIKVQVPYELTGLQDAEVEATFRGVPSNRIRVQIVPARPGLFLKTGSVTEALGRNENQAPNSSNAPAATGSVLSLFATGYGQTKPDGITGKIAADPFPAPLRNFTVSIGGVDATVIGAREASGQLGVLQIDVRVPTLAGSGTRSLPVILSSDGVRSRPDVRVWVQ